MPTSIMSAICLPSATVGSQFFLTPGATGYPKRTGNLLLSGIAQVPGYSTAWLIACLLLVSQLAQAQVSGKVVREFNINGVAGTDPAITTGLTFVGGTPTTISRFEHNKIGHVSLGDLEFSADGRTTANVINNATTYPWFSVRSGNGVFFNAHGSEGTDGTGNLITLPGFTEVAVGAVDNVKKDSRDSDGLLISTGTGAYAAFMTGAPGEMNHTFDFGFVAPVCSISVVALPAPCNPATNSYVLSGTIATTNVPAIGTLTITSAAFSPRSLTLPAGNATGTFSYSGLVSNAQVYTVTVSYSNSACAPVSQTYTAPVSCTQPTGTQLALAQVVSTNRAKLGDILTYTVVLTNTGSAPATNVIVQDVSTTGLTYIANSATPPAGTTFTQGLPTSTWKVAAISAGQSLSLTFQAKVDSSGILYNTATIPGDTATVCTSVPVLVCTGDVYTFELTAAPGRSSYRWFKDNLELIGQTTNVLNVTAPGTYSLAVDNVTGKCPDFSCCPFIVQEDTLPTFRAVATPVTCIGNVAQTNGRITLSQFKTGYTYQYSAGSTFNPATSLSGAAKVIPANGLLVSTLANPVVATAYTVRVYNASGCYTDVTVMLVPTICGCPADVCVPLVIQQTKRPKRIGDPR